jgi:hypothetical protein
MIDCHDTLTKLKEWESTLQIESLYTYILCIADVHLFFFVNQPLQKNKEKCTEMMYNIWKKINKKKKLFLLQIEEKDLFSLLKRGW